MTLGEKAEEIIRTLPGVLSARVISADDYPVREVHVVATPDLPEKQVLRNIEQALVQHFGLRIDQRRITITTAEVVTTAPSASAAVPASESHIAGDGGMPSAAGRHAPPSAPAPGGTEGDPLLYQHRIAPTPRIAVQKRGVYFEDLEIRGSRIRGVWCRVTLARRGRSHVGESRGVDGDRARLELAARATCSAIGNLAEREGLCVLEGVRLLEAFERKFVLAGVMVVSGRAPRLLSGTCEVVDSAETAAVLAVLDATNRWLEREM